MYHVGLNNVERLKQHLMPDLDRLCVGGSFGGRQNGSNKASSLVIKRQEHAMQRVRHIDSYRLVLVEYSIIACVASMNENDARILA